MGFTKYLIVGFTTPYNYEGTPLTTQTITKLDLCDTDLIGTQNVGKWGEALITNTTITRLRMDDGAEKDAIKKRTRALLCCIGGRTPRLDI